jgi:bifunctional non-homologous end joining protein LigD
MEPKPSAMADVTRPDKLLWPDIGVTKRDYVDYLAAVAGHMLPWLRDRPLTVVRAPDGVGKKTYFQKAVSSYAPSWIRTVEIPAPSAGRDVAYPICNDVRSLTWMGNQAALELHPAPVRRDQLERCDLLVIDVDPPDDAFDAGVEVAVSALEVLADLDLPAGVKTTGGKGLHVVVPIERRLDGGALRQAASALTEIVASRLPDAVTEEFRKADRGGRVMLDPSRNAPGATIVAPYSPRARPAGTVSFPVDASELRRVDASAFTLLTGAGMLDGDGPRRWKELEGERGRIPARLLGR